MKGYSATIKEASFQLSAKQRVGMKDTSNAVRLDECVSEEEHIVISPENYVVLSVHNDRSENPDYELFLVLAKDGKKYLTSSPSFVSAFLDIWEEMAGESEEYEIEIYKLPSKNYKGKSFLSCSIVC